MTAQGLAKTAVAALVALGVWFYGALALDLMLPAPLYRFFSEFGLLFDFLLVVLVLSSLNLVFARLGNASGTE